MENYNDINYEDGIGNVSEDFEAQPWIVLAMVLAVIGAVLGILV